MEPVGGRLSAHGPEWLRVASVAPPGLDAGRRGWTCSTLSTVAVFLLVGGWPGSGKTTLARALAPELQLPLLVKDEIKEALSDGLGRPQSVEESQRLGRVAVTIMLRVARRCPGAVLDSTWFEHTRPLLAVLPGTCVEVRCTVPIEVAQSRY